MKKYLLVFCFVSLSSLANNNIFNSAKIIENLNSKSVNKTYNLSKVEGWAYVSYIVNLQGKASDIVVINSSNDNPIETASNYLNKLSYSPATVNGTAVLEAQTLFFTNNKQVNSSGKGAVSKGFLNKYNEAYKVVTSKNKASAKEALNDLIDTYAKNFEEQALSHWLHSIYYFLNNEWGMYYESIKKSYFLGKNLPRDIEVKNTKNLLDWYIFKKSYPEALKVLVRLNNIKGRDLSPESYTLKYNEIVSGQEIDKIIDTEFIFYGRRNSWLQELSHSVISFESSNNDLTTVELRCRNAVHKFNKSIVENFQIPKRYMSCSILVQAPTGTVFKLTERANTAKLTHSNNSNHILQSVEE